jgi:Lipocalin-like domain
MNIRTLTRATMLPLLVTVALPADDASGQAAKGLMGAWTLVSVTVEQDGKKVEPFGSNPNGSLMLDSNGHFSIVVVRPGVLKFASNNRVAGTAEENTAAVRGSLGYFGTYSLSEADRLISMHIEGSTFPNWNGTEQKRMFTLEGDQLTLTNPTGSAGGTTQIVWRRAK